jgi:hypothetical protein
MSSQETTKTAGQVLLHFGAGKTGSTAIQNMLYENRQTLSTLGINYTDSRILHNSIQSGNGDEICLRLREGASSFEIKKLLASRIGIGKLSIISCEEFAALAHEHLDTLFKSLNQLEIEFKVLIYVRNPVGYYISAYGQAVKRHGYANTFNDFLDGSSWKHAEQLTKLKAFSSIMNMTVVSFDQNKQDLSKSFWKSVNAMFGINVKNSFAKSDLVSNRSLYQEELRFLLKINELFGSRFSTLVSDYLINESSFIGSPVSLTQQQVTKIEIRHADDAKRINLEFFNNKPIISLSSTKDLGVISKRLKTYPSAELLTNLLLYLMRNIEYVIETSGLKDVQALRKCLSNGIYFEAMPNGEIFDNVFYLLHNLDVVRSNDNPLNHYLNHGKAEDRIWRIKKEI